jgi:hypothetical protein
MEDTKTETSVPNSSFTLENSKISIKKKNSKTASSITFGERLYRKSIAIQEVKETKAKLEKTKQQHEMKKRCSFKPQLIESNYFTVKDQFENVMERLNTYAANEGTLSLTNSPVKRKKNIESYIKKKEEEDLKELK